MKRLVLIISAIFSLAGMQAQTYLEDGDVVSISFIANDLHYYLEASGNGILTKTYPTDNCLWELGITQNGQYTLKDLSTGRYLGWKFTDPSNSQMLLVNTDNPSAFSFENQNSVQDKYMHGYLYYSEYYAPWWNTIAMYIDGEWGGSGPYFTTHNWHNYELYIEKWEQKGAGSPTGHFNPSKIEFSYIGDQEGEAETDDDPRTVEFMIEATTESYYQCVNRPEEALLRRSTGNVDGNDIQIKNIYWQSTGDSKGKSSNLEVSKYVAHQDANRTLMTLSAVTQSEGKWQFTITPEDGNPMGLMDMLGSSKRWIDYADNVVVEFTYGNSSELQTAQMRVVRKSYHEEQLPALTFSINPVTYTFSKEEETKQFDVELIHQHGTVIYNVDNQAIKTVYTYDSVHVNLSDFDEKFTAEDGWEKTYRFYSNPADLSTHWLTVNDNEFQNEGNLYITAKANDTHLKRSDTLIVTLNKTKGDHQHAESFKIPLSQRGVEGGIKFLSKIGQGNTALGKNPHDNRDEQQVHTAERTIYYLPNQDIELRLPESGYSGYMRWYDYETNGDPYYNYARGNEYASTSWVRSPRAANGNAFSAINTPRSSESIGDEGVSYGLYAINKASRGGVLDEGNPSNPAPILKGWDYDPDKPATAHHIMACDVSAYTDYTIWTSQNGARIDSIMEPTLSYRQLFHLRPASEMADKLKNLGDDKYLEEYQYIAPAGKQILLSTEFRHSKVRSHESELCYFYWNGGDQPARVNGNVTWKKDGATHSPRYIAELDYLIVRSEVPDTVTYTLTVNDTGERIARFVVAFVDVEKYGPTNKTIITKQRITNEFEIRELIDFNDEGEIATLTDGSKHLNKHLDWQESTYGYVYPAGELATKFKRGADQGAFPFYGEYSLVNEVKKGWASAEQLGGKDNGFAIYVDGTMEPGLVASITANANICEGQTMYCSAWFCNPAPANWSGEGNPIFRCNIEGLLGGEWKNVATYFVGELLKGTGWQQVVFPIQSQESYDEIRVSIYNFATTNQGNDFMVDDICLYVSRLPIAAYQGEMACRTVEGGEASAAAVLRIDYSNINAGDDGYMYYQIYNESWDANNDQIADGAPVRLTEEAAYYHESHTSSGTPDHDHDNQELNDFGSVHIPAVNFDPKHYNDSLFELDNNRTDTLRLYTSVSAFLDDLVLNNEKHGKAYIKTDNSGVTKWLLYVAHIILNTDDVNEACSKLFDEHDYVMRMAYTPEELDEANCNLTTPLHATQQTVFRLRNSNQETILHSSSDGEKQTAHGGVEKDVHSYSEGNCPNDLYSLTATVVNHLAINGVGTTTEYVSAPIFSDWLIGDPIGDILSQKAPVKGDMTDEQYQAVLNEYNQKVQESIAGFKKMYGYTHDEVTTAIMYDMRRFVTDDPNSPEYNPNHRAKSFEELQYDKFLSFENYTIIKHLCDSGWLQLYDTTAHFYLGSRLDKDDNTIGDTVRYWCFPIAETAKTILKVDDVDTEVTLKDCNEPHRVMVSATGSEYYYNIAPIPFANKTPQQSVQLPTLKVLEGSTTITFPVTELGGAKISGQLTEAEKTTITLDLAKATYINLETGKIYQTTPELVAGNEYTIRLTLLDEHTGVSAPDGDGCPYGYVFLNLQIVPKNLVWSPSGNSFNGWGKDENWKGWVDKNHDNVINETNDPATNELVEGYVPMEGADVIIPKLDNALLYPYIVPEHEHSHYPMTINAEPHHCNQIYFAPGAKIHNQHLLHYEKAFVDMQITAGKWNMMSAPLKKMVSGDMFIPHTGKYNEAGALIAEPNPFTVSGFQGLRHRDAAYLFYQHFYNQTVYSHYEDGGTTSAASIGFEESNSLSQPLQAGGGYSLYGVGMVGKETLTIRLPKPDTEYYYYTSTGVQSTNKTSVDRGENNESYRLAFDAPHDAEHADQKMEILLTNHTATDRFLFGNPTMAYIDMKLFLETNSAVLNPVFHRIEGSVWTASTELSMHEDRYLAPMTSVLLETQHKQPLREISVTLSVDHLTLNNTVDFFAEETENAPRRLIASSPDNHTSELLTIYAFTPKGTARTVLATNPAASDYFVQGEDALFVSSGIENNTSVKSPLNMYTVAEQVPMMADVRQGISQIPLAILADTKTRVDYMQLAFYSTPNWTRECYLVDSHTGQKIRIMNGLIISVEMPQNHEQRYFIEGPDEYIGSNNNQGGGVTTSTLPVIAPADEIALNAFSINANELVVTASSLMREVKIYDMTGRLIADKVLDLLHNSTTLAAPSGICIVEAILRDGTSLHTQTLVR
ncbi:MAG: hypothetical protein IKB40_08145 [Paludibacteraceae bacterium]|nr:hypothetical protein [Paludibacteraceae bacterium]